MTCQHKTNDILWEKYGQGQLSGSGMRQSGGREMFLWSFVRIDAGRKFM